VDYRVLLYYAFTAVEDPDALADAHRNTCEQLGLRGRILIAPEGLNGTVSGLAADCEAYTDWVRQDPRFAEIEFKIDEADSHAFKALHVRRRNEVLALGRPLEQPIEARTGVHLSPREWQAMMDEDDVVILDGRNAYESEVGRFKGAICPPVQNFRELPAWIEKNSELFEGKKVLTYCTGGIRCEKLSAWMLDAGISSVFQLHGGIVEYGKHPDTQGEGFEGVNVVFDDRVAVPAGEKANVVTRCRECGALSANYVNCANVECNLRMIQCPQCEELTGRACSPECRTAPRQRLKGRKWHENRTAWDSPDSSAVSGAKATAGAQKPTGRVRTRGIRPFSPSPKSGD
jgi:UPF0176 protein